LSMRLYIPAVGESGVNSRLLKPLDPSSSEIEA
jgi:hypothetical protein